ncbi:hypothetical protein [Streptomyces sp. NPDC048442]|uniref:hypothetical protein n=1 Tax=Streptomyces sp. NPDC048442 TaxID=3154823 RepID=UPI003432BE56
MELQDVLHDRPPAHLGPADLEHLRPSWLHPAAETDTAGTGAETDVELPYPSRLGGLKFPSPDARFEFSLTLLTEGVAALAQQAKAI